VNDIRAGSQFYSKWWALVPRGGIALILQILNLTREFLRDFEPVPAAVPSVSMVLSPRPSTRSTAFWRTPANDHFFFDPLASWLRA
jgi:hypothetical protein